MYSNLNSAVEGYKLKEVFEQLFDDMQEKGMLPASSTQHKEQIIDELVKDFSGPDKIKDITFADLKSNADTVRFLCAAVAEKDLSYRLDPEKRFQLNDLFNNKKLDEKEEKEKLKDELKCILKTLYEMRPEPDKKRLDDDELEKKLDELADKMANKLQEKGGKSEKETKDVFIDELTKALENLYGGIDPTKEGSIQKIVHHIVGNMSGIPSRNTGGPLSMAFIDSFTRPDFKSDSLGIERKIMERLEAIGSSGMEITSNFNPSPSNKPH